MLRRLCLFVRHCDICMYFSGRLGLDLTEYGDPQKDSSTPKLVQALMGRPVIRISAGYSHTGCIVAGGELYMW